jgi:hypothetical protein
MAAYLCTNKISLTIEYIQGTDITLDYSSSINADLISIMTEQDKSLSNLLLESNTHQIINKACVSDLSMSTQHMRMVSEDFRTEGIYKLHFI